MKVTEDWFGLYWSGGIVYKSDGGPVWTAGTSAGVIKLSIKVLEDRFGLLEYLVVA